VTSKEAGTRPAFKALSNSDGAGGRSSSGHWGAPSGSCVSGCTTVRHNADPTSSSPALGVSRLRRFVATVLLPPAASVRTLAGSLAGTELVTATLSDLHACAQRCALALRPGSLSVSARVLALTIKLMVEPGPQLSVLCF
jgi:hypothetical protein